MWIHMSFLIQKAHLKQKQRNLYRPHSIFHEKAKAKGGPEIAWGLHSRFLSEQELRVSTIKGPDCFPSCIKLEIGVNFEDSDFLDCSFLVSKMRF